MSDIKILELFSGIGGMHYAFKESGIADGKIMMAIDINTFANQVYQHNFPEINIYNNNIQNLSVDTLNQLEINTILMSPPCQPFTRTGLQRDIEDARTDALLHICKNIIPNLNHLNYVLLENVKGFETSRAHKLFIECLTNCTFYWREFLLCPNQLGISPNTRLRYYCIARKSNDFTFSINNNCNEMLLLSDLPSSMGFSSNKELTGTSTDTLDEYCPNKKCKLNDNCKLLIKDFLNNTATINITDNIENYQIPDNVLIKRANQFDIVYGTSDSCNCFTKAYTHYAKGTGSVYCPKNPDYLNEIFVKINDGQSADTNNDRESSSLNLLKTLQLRYFTPMEIANFMGFPIVNNFSFPKCITKSQQYRLLGNSINVQLVSELIKLLFQQ